MENKDGEHIHEVKRMLNLQDKLNSISEEEDYLKKIEESRILLYDIKSRLEAISRKHESKSSTKSKKSCTRSKRPSNAVENRLTAIKKKEDERLNARMIEQIKKEVEDIRAIPKISEHAKRLTHNIPLHKRTDCILLQKALHIERLRATLMLQQQMNEEKKLQSKMRKERMCMTERKLGGKDKSSEVTTEEKEILDNCTFMPSTNERSGRIFSKMNRDKKPVVNRLLDYGMFQADKRERKLQATMPSFTPNAYRKSRGGFKVRVRINIGNIREVL